MTGQCINHDTSKFKKKQCRSLMCPNAKALADIEFWQQRSLLTGSGVLLNGLSPRYQQGVHLKNQVRIRDLREAPRIFVNA